MEIINILKGLCTTLFSLLHITYATQVQQNQFEYSKTSKENVESNRTCNVYEVSVEGINADFRELECGKKCTVMMQCFGFTAEGPTCKLCIDSSYNPPATQNVTKNEDMKQCEKVYENTNKCASNPCGNNGVCHEINDGYNCTCNQGYSGTHCHIAQQCGGISGIHNQKACVRHVTKYQKYYYRYRYRYGYYKTRVIYQTEYYCNPGHHLNGTQCYRN